MKKKRNMKKWYEKRQGLVGDYRTWFWARIVKVFAVLIFLGLLSQTVDNAREAGRVKVAIKNAQAAGKDVKSDPVVRRHKESGAPIPPLLALTSLLVALISAPTAGMCQELQHTSQNGIDDVLLGKPTMHLAEIFPHKGIRIHRRELRIYKGRIRRFRRALRQSGRKTRDSVKNA